MPSTNTECLSQPHHLLVLVNGLWGGPSDWRQAQKRLTAALAPRGWLVHSSTVNVGRRTYEGVDVCGERLVCEVRGLVARQPGLQTISFCGHSMGGLIARYAAGHLYCDATGLMAGLQPRHFVSMATPHLGCAATGIAAVPFLPKAGADACALPQTQQPRQRWHFGLPSLRAWVRKAAPAITAAWVGRSGLQLFHEDRSSGGNSSSNGSSSSVDGAREAALLNEAQPDHASSEQGRYQAKPLLERMTLEAQDTPSGSAPYMPALRSFVTRTTYASTCGDALVGCANGTLRTHAEASAAARMAALAGRNGVVLQEPLAAAFWPPGSATTASAAACASAAAAAVAAAAAAAGAERASKAGPVLELQARAALLPVQLPAPLPAAATGALPSQVKAQSLEVSPHGGASSGVARGSPLLGHSASAPSCSAAHATSNSTIMVAAPAAQSTVTTANISTAAGNGSTDDSDNARAAAAVPAKPAPPLEQVQVQMLRRLAALPWRRVDVTFSNKLCLGTAHCNIQYNGPINFEGASVVDHLVGALLDMEGAMEGL